MSGEMEPKDPLLLSRSKVCQALQISKREFYALIANGKLHPITTAQRHMRVPLAEVMAIKAEFTHRVVALPHEKLIQAIAIWAPSLQAVNETLLEIGFPKAPLDYIERLRTEAKGRPDLQIIRAINLQDLIRQMGKAWEILRRPDFKLMVECLTMIVRGEEEISQTLRAKYGREYTKDEVLRFVEYCFNWKIMDPASVAFYFEFLQGREKLMKECAYRRADYFIIYALGIDFGGEVSELLERSCLGLLHKMNVMIDGYVYGDVAVSHRDLDNLADIIGKLLCAARDIRQGKVPKGKQQEIADIGLPKAVTRTQFFETEKGTSFASRQ